MQFVHVILDATPPILSNPIVARIWHGAWDGLHVHTFDECVITLFPSEEIRGDGIRGVRHEFHVASDDIW